MKIKTLLAALLIAALLLTPVAMMEESDAAPTVTLEETASVAVTETDCEPDGEAPAVTDEEDADKEPNSVANEEETPEASGEGAGDDVVDETGELEIEIVPEAVDEVVVEAENADLSMLEAQSDGYELDFESIEESSTEVVEMPTMLLAEGNIDIEASFPDSIFRSYVLPFDVNNDGKLSAEERSAVTEISVYSSGIKDLTGIKLFPNLTELRCGNIQLTALDVSDCNNLTRLVCHNNNKLNKLDVSGCSKLTELRCEFNLLTTLNISGCSNLTSLWCFNNKLTALDVSGCTNLITLECYNNRLTTLNVSGCSNLTTLWCYNNQLIALDVSDCSKLFSLVCDKNKLSTLDVSKLVDLVQLRCDKNKISILDITNCDYLVEITISDNLDVSDPSIISYDAYKNRFLITDANVKIIGTISARDTPNPAQGTPITTVTTPATPVAPAESVTITKTPASAKVKAGKKGKVTVSWKKIKKTKKTKALLKQIKGIQVQYSTDPTFATNVQTRNLGKKKTKVTLKGLQKKTVYYVRIRYIDGAGGVSNWSATKKVKTKK